MIERTLRYSLWFLATLVLVGFLALTLRGLVHSPNPDPAEATALARASRVAHGQALYLANDPQGPDAMPGVPAVLAGFVVLFGAAPWEPRLLTALASLFAALLVARIVRAETKNDTLGVVGGAFLLLGLALAGVSPTALRADPPMLLLAIVGYMTLRWTKGIPGALLGALALSAACFMHTAGLWFAFAAFLHLAELDRRRCIAYGLGLLLFLGGGYVAFWQLLGPWFNFRAFDQPLTALRFQPVAVVDFLGRQLLGALGVLSLATVLSFAMPNAPWRGDIGAWTWMGFAALGAGLAATQTVNGVADALRPAAVALAIAGPISIQRVTQHLSAWPGSTRLDGKGVVLTALALQFLTLIAHLPLASFYS